MAGSSPGRRTDQNDTNNYNGESVTYTSYFESFPIPFIFRPQRSVHNSSSSSSNYMPYLRQSSNDATKQSRLHQGLLISRRMSALIATYFVRGIKRRHVYLLLFTAILFCWIWLSTIRVYAVLGKYKVKNYLYDTGLLSCSLRKEPIIYVLDTYNVVAVWESNCMMENVRLRWYRESNAVHVIHEMPDSIIPTVIDNNHYVYKATIGPLRNVDTYRYEITYSKNNDNIILVAQYSFPFFPSIPSSNKTRQGRKKDKHKLSYPINIFAFSDNQFGLRVFNELVESAAARHKQPHYILHAGDAVQEYKNLQQWQTDFYDPLTASYLGQQAPLIYAHGNHDYDPDLEYTYTGKALWYSFKMANSWWIVLDSNMDDMKQDEWLENELASAESQSADFRVVIVHIPPFLEYWDPDSWHEKGEKHWGEFVRTRFVPLFRKYKVDLVISGHQHNYQRGDRDGITYAIIGGAGGSLDYDRVENYKFYVTEDKKHHYVLMELWPKKIVCSAYSLDGVMLDKFLLRSRA
ncbi:5610_t:CDS:1 [Paraglomus occultum]|uniref:5610_t:CDS:1 n=1 Tax=Paraglomus occultum TaxID=144539 RepID=A0A9N9FN40_9GLOM|nr:5610_t:CDS:1 [Paraglomus occultum]